ncbi:MULTISPECIES: phosphoglycerate kinase [Pseudomonas]|uniref:phosphoglycerate kinase n=1 Tax=Pseudomonas TaxID=286 RepID=UPI00028C920C|nr:MULTISPECIES: phosphoglycerate kinase [Pseudomonas]EKG37733.1 Phosphoglycerate kinase [Pseudomonas syringae pv. avellanae str. ISPaVe037]POP71765.1 phosphoglycerate kinase [Pseudomonas syringae]
MSTQPALLYSAGININPGVHEHPRIDEDVSSLIPLLSNERRIIILNHQGDFKKGTAQQTPWLATLLARRLGRPVAYLEDCVGQKSLEYARRMAPGSIALFSNTRLYPQEQNNDRDFARQLAALGSSLVIGGFCKLHRKNASNDAIKEFLPWQYSHGVESQLRALQHLYETLYRRQRTLLLLGGNKVEKVDFLVSHQQRLNVHAIIAGGAVLNSVLHALGLPIGRSIYYPLTLPHDVLRKIHLPELLLVESERGAVVPRALQAVKADDNIIDFVIDERIFNEIERTPEKFSFFAAGPLSTTASQHSHRCYRRLEQAGVKGLFMGGDTLTEVKTFSSLSSGGGAALQFFSSSGALPSCKEHS